MKRRLGTGDRIRYGIEKIQIAIVDDNADIVKKGVTSVIDCMFTSFTIQEAYNKFLKDKNYFLDSYDLLILDATYRENNDKYCTLDLLETMISYNPKYKDSSIVLLGKDVEANRWDELLGDIVKRAKNLPNMVYNNKIETVINIIEARGKKLGISVPRKLQESCAITSEFSESVEKISKDFRRVISMMEKTVYNSQEILKIVPQSEEERYLLNKIENIETIIFDDIHKLNQFLEYISRF